MTESEFQSIDKQNWDLSLKTKSPVETYRKLREEIEEKMQPEPMELTPELTAWYRET